MDTFVEEDADHDTESDEGDVVDDKENEDDRRIGGVEDAAIFSDIHMEAQKVKRWSHQKEDHRFGEDSGPVHELVHSHQLHRFLWKKRDRYLYNHKYLSLSLRFILESMQNHLE